jgi:hypothetical protein
MENEASHFAYTLEKIGRNVLEQCQGLPDNALQWPFPFIRQCSLLTCAVELERDVNEWVLLPIGGKQTCDDDAKQIYTIHTGNDLTRFYETWIQKVHEILDSLPNAYMNLFIGSRLTQKHGWEECSANYHTLTTRQCLLTAITRCAQHAGQISTIRLCMDNGGRLLHDVQIESWLMNS